MNYDTAAAVACLTSVFLEVLEQDFPTLKSFEEEVIDVGHNVMTKAMSSALEIFDEKLCKGYASALRIKEKRERRLATRIGDVDFRRRICTDKYGNPLVPLDEVLDLPHGTRISPGAACFLSNAGIEVSYAKAAHLLENPRSSRAIPQSPDPAIIVLTRNYLEHRIPHFALIVLYIRQYVKFRLHSNWQSSL